MAAASDDAWRQPPPHFKADPRWQRQPQSVEEWDAYQDPTGARHFRAKRRLAFAGDLADPRAPGGMALVSRLDLIVVLGRLAWLEARFENTSATVIPPVNEDPSGSVLAPKEATARMIAEARRYLLPGNSDTNIEYAYAAMVEVAHG